MTTLIGINVVDAFRLSAHYGIYSKKNKKFIGDDDDYSVRAFAGVLTNQLILYAKRQEYKEYSPRRTLHFSPAKRSKSDQSDDIEYISSGEEDHGNNLVDNEKESRLDIVDTLYDINGDVHHAVKHDFKFSADGK